MKDALIFLLMTVLGLGPASQAAAGFRISGLQCVRSMPDREQHSQAAAPALPQASGETLPTVGMASGQGYILSGTVRSAAGRRPVRQARIEVWQAGAKEQYGKAPLTTVFSEESGKYRVEGICPPQDHSGAPESACGFRPRATRPWGPNITWGPGRPRQTLTWR